MEVLLLTEQQKELLIGNTYCDDSYFNPIQDINDDWVISLEERDYLTNDNFIWVNNLPIIEYKPKPPQPF